MAVTFVEVDASQKSVYGITDLKLMIYNCAITMKYKQRSLLNRSIVLEKRLLDREVKKRHYIVIAFNCIIHSTCIW